jgi:hypothetical protein
MKKIPQSTLTVLIGITTLCSMQSVVAETENFKWRTVVDNNKNPPGITTEKFFSYNQPSLNDYALVVFRARAKSPTGGQGGGEPTRGVFTRNMLTSRAINTIASTKPNKDVVPGPNNITTPKPATFNEFPAFPRIDKLSNTVAFRAQSQPTWADPVLGKLGGTSGVYANPFNTLKTGVRNLEVTAQFPQYFVPSVALSVGSPQTRFDQFPGAPGISETNRVTFKGNYADNSVSKTGIFSRKNLISNSPVKAIAWTGLNMPDNKGVPTGAKFGSTAPPSTARNQVVFAGFDNEETPTAGGIFHARLDLANPQLKALVAIGMPVPNVTGATFTRFGEALSFDGRYVSFWGAWGTGKLDPVSGGDGWKPVDLTCPKDGNKDVIQSCRDQDNSGTPNDGNYRLFEPTNQGMFVYDTVGKSARMVARTNGVSGFTDFLFWSFTGAPPGVGGGDEGSTEDRELPRWRSSAFAAVNGQDVAFKAKKSKSNGIYFRQKQGSMKTVLDSNMTGNVLDKKTIIVVKNNDGSTTKVPLSQLLITTLGLERDGFRNGRLAISASMADISATYSWAGIYIGEMDDD